MSTDNAHTPSRQQASQPNDSVSQSVNQSVNQSVSHPENNSSLIGVDDVDNKLGKTLDPQTLLSQIQDRSTHKGSSNMSYSDGIDSLSLDALAGDGEYDRLLTDCDEAIQSLLTIRDYIRFCVTQLRNYDVVVAQGTNDVFAEAAAIVLHPLSLDWNADDQILECRLTTSEKGEIVSLLQSRIINRQPLSYLVNLAYFCDLPFYVDERVLIPRSPIAELIRQQFYPYFETNQFAQPLGPDSTVDIPSFHLHGLEDKQLYQPERILDLCTGSGCIAVALVSRFRDALVDATDIDTSALEVAAVNIEHHGMDHQINLIESDLFEKLPSENQYELIVTNPPYVDAAAMAELPPEFIHEPEHALAAGQDGLDLVHKILYEAPDYLTQEGLLICEVGDSDWALRQAYPEIQFNWLSFARGGHGVFAMDRDELISFRHLFEAQVAQL